MCGVYFCPHLAISPNLSTGTEERVLIAGDPAVSGITGMRGSFAMAGDAHCFSVMRTRTCGSSATGASGETELRLLSVRAIYTGTQTHTREVKVKHFWQSSSSVQLGECTRTNIHLGKAKCCQFSAFNINCDFSTEHFVNTSSCHLCSAHIRRFLRCRPWRVKMGGWG